MKHYKSVEFVNFYKCQAPFTEVKNKSFWWRFWLYESWPESETASLSRTCGCSDVVAENK